MKESITINNKINLIIMKPTFVLLLIALLLFRGSLLSQNDLSRVRNSEVRLKLDTLKIQAVNNVSGKSWIDSSAMPWIVAAFIGVTTIAANLITSFIARRVSVKTVEKQIETSFRVASFQYQATLNSNNRQEWINMVREALSDLITQCKLLNIEFQEPVQKKEREEMLHEKLTLSRSKLLLLLNPKNSTHKEFLQLLKELMVALDLHMFNAKHNTGEVDNLAFFQKSEKVVEVGRELLYIEWGKIQDRSVVD